MQVHTINNHPTNFGAIHQSTKVEFTPEQNEVIDDIIKTLRKSSLRYGNKTAENYYKAKKNIDFCIGSYNRNDNSVYLDGWYNKKETNDNIEYEKPFHIGIYNPNRKFRVSDIKTGMNDSDGPSLFQIMLVPALVLAGLFGLKACNKITPEQTKPLIENTEKYINDFDSLEARTIVNTKLWKI